MELTIVDKLRQDGRFVTSNSVEILIDILRNWLDLSLQVILDIEHVVLVIFTDEVDRDTQVAESSGTTNPMEIGVRLAREVKVDNNVDGDDVDTTGKDI